MFRRIVHARRILVCALLGIAAAALLASCDLGDEVVSPPPQPVVAQVFITSHMDTVLAAVAAPVQFTAVALDASSTAIVAIPFDWITDDTNVALVDVFGIALGIAEGRTNVRATRGAVQSAPVELRVRRATQVVASVTITGPALPQVQVGGTIAFTAEARDALGDPIAGATFQWFSLNPSVAGIDVNGVARGLAVGMSDIRARSDGIDSAPVTLTVTAPAVATVEITGPSQVNLGSMASFTAVARDAGGTPIAGAPFTWSSSNTSVASVDANGVATGLAVGSTDIRATSESVASPPATLTVVTPAPSFATDIQPILHPTCTATNCHGGSFPQEGLDLRPASAYGELVNRLSTQLTTLLLVEPGDPDNSYLLRKLSTCIFPNCSGSRMPRDLPPLRTEQIDLIRNWIATGAQP